MTTQTQQKYVPLAPKELLYLQGRAHGLTNKEVARLHGVSPRTVIGAMERVLYKMHARKITEAVFKAASEGMLMFLFTLALFTSAFNVTDQPYRISPNRARPTTSIRIRTKEDAHV